jgi:excinuclease UvrABC ATPase subunit
LRVRLDGTVYNLDAAPALAPRRPHTIEIVVDRLIIGPDITTRLTDSVETALQHADGLVGVDIVDGDEFLYSQHLSCPDCGLSYAEITPRLFSFNSPQGACPACDGLGAHPEFDPDLVVVDPTAPILEGAISAWGRRAPAHMKTLLQGVAVQDGVDLTQPCETLSDVQQPARCRRHYPVLMGVSPTPVAMNRRQAWWAPFGIIGLETTSARRLYAFSPPQRAFAGHFSLCLEPCSGSHRGRFVGHRGPGR